MLRLLVIGLGDPVPIFVLRRLQRLDKEGVRLIIVCRASTIPFFDGLAYATILPYLRVDGIRNAVRLIAPAMLNFYHWPKLWKQSMGVSFFRRLSLVVENCQWLLVPRPDVIHLQWLSPPQRLHLFQALFPNSPIMVSVRGSQVTVQNGENSTYDHFLWVNFAIADCIHCVSHDIGLQCRRLGAPPEKIFINYNGVNISRFRLPSETQVNEGPIRLVSVGALIWRKGYIFQLQLVKRLVERGIPSTLKIIGSGLDEIGLRYWAHRLSLSEFIKFEGQKNENEVIAELKSSDVYLSTSAAEGLPNSLVEAAACGLPIVTFNCEGVREVVLDSVTGYIVPFGAIDEAVEKIILLKDEPARKKMGALARAKMEREFSDDYWVSEMIKKYQSMVIPKEKE